MTFLSLLPHLHTIFTTDLASSPHLHIFTTIFTTFLSLLPHLHTIFTTDLASMPHLHIFTKIFMTHDISRQFSPHFHYKTNGANYKLHLHHIFTTFTCHQTIGANYKLDFH